MKKVLWIEDQALYEMRDLRSKVLMSGLYHLAIAKNGSEAISKLRSEIYDIIVVDLRIPPGDDPAFSISYSGPSHQRNTAKVGFQLLKRIFDKADPNHLSDLFEYAYNPFRFGVLSVDNQDEIGEDLNFFGIKNYFHKSGFMSSDTLLNLIKKIDKLISNE